MKNPLIPLLQSLLDTGELASPITFDGVPMAEASAGPPPVPPVTYGVDGWATSQITSIGGRRSQGVDALITELVNAGGANAAIAAFLPQYHVGLFWQGPTVPADNFETPGVFATPVSASSLVAAQVQQAIFNVNALWNREFGFGLMGGNPVPKYRGDPNTAAPGVIDEAVQYTPNARAWEAIGMSFYDVAFYNIAGGFHGAHYSAANKVDKAVPLHNVYDAFFDVTSDANVTRFLRNFAIRIGATIPA